VIVNKKFWKVAGRHPHYPEGPWPEATKYANDIAKKKNDEDLAAVKASASRRSSSYPA